MSGLTKKIIIFLILFRLYSLNHPFHPPFGLKPSLQLCIVLIAFLHPSFKINLHSFVFMVCIHLILIFILLVVCFVLLPSHERDKLFAQLVKCAILVYPVPISLKGILCYGPQVLFIGISRNVKIFEDQYFF